MTTQFTIRYNAMMEKARGLARKEMSPLIERWHLFSAIIKISPRLFHRLLGKKNLTFPKPEPLPIEAEETGGNIHFSADVYRILSLNGGVLGDVMNEVGLCAIDIQHVAAALLLDSDRQSPVREIVFENGINPDEARESIFTALKKMGDGSHGGIGKSALKKINEIRTRLLSEIVGQDEAVNQICTALLEFWNRPLVERVRPLSIFICGATGSGKSFLAEKFMEAVEWATGGKHVEILNAGMYSSRDSSRDIVGLDCSWRGGPRPGTVTLPIHDNPSGVICLDNVDTLHEIGLNHITRIISTGRIKDEGLAKMVDFRDAICIFISSAGSGGLSVGNDAKSAAMQTRSRLAEELCAGIQSSEVRRNVRAMVEQVTLPIVMKPLGVDELRELMRRAVSRQIVGLRRLAKKVEADAAAIADLLIQTILSLDARAIESIAGEITAAVRNAMVGGPCDWWKIKTFQVSVEGGEPYDSETISKNLHMRKRQTVKMAFSMDGAKGVLAISASGHVLLPAVTDGIIRIEPPNDADTFDKLVGISAPVEYTERWRRFFAGETKSRPENLILSGPPGCGKTSFVRCLARELGRPYAVLDCNDLATPRAVLDAFAKIRRYAGDGILAFFDEIDAIAGDRSGKSEDYIERINTFLGQMDGFNHDPNADKILYLAATNRLSDLDSAAVRNGRLGQCIIFAPLQEEERLHLVQLAGKEYGVDIDSSLAKFIAETSEAYAPSTIKGIIREMAFTSAKPTRADYLRARRVVVEGAYTQHTVLRPEDEFDVALHEIGHAWCCDKRGRRFVQATIVSGGSNLGVLEEFANNGGCHSTSKDILNSIDVALSGRAAQEVVLGRCTDGAVNDIQAATKFAMQYVRAGFSSYGLGVPPDGFDWDEISSVVRKLLDSRYAAVKRQMAGEKRILRRLASLLQEKKIIFQDELQGVCRNAKAERSISHV